MYVDAEDRLAALVDQNETDGMLFKIRDDPRVFPVGRFLRASSHRRAAAADQRAARARCRWSARGRCPPTTATSSATSGAGCWSGPGITGLWQVSGRSDLSWDEAVRLDLYYVDNWSLAST